MVVIIGAGIAGAAAAYYYMCSPPYGSPPRAVAGEAEDNVTIVDAVGPAAGASGNAGAYLSRQWGDKTKREGLFARSFDLHEKLAVELGLRSFHYLDSYRVELNEDQGKAIDEKEYDESQVTWRDRVTSVDAIPGSAAIVDPEELTKALLDRAVQNGASLMIQSVCGFEVDEDDKSVTSIHFDDGDSLDLKDEENVVIAIGPWSSRIEDWFNTPLPVDGVVSASLTWDRTTTGSTTKPAIPPLDAALFCQDDSNGCHLEILPRFDGSLYVSGCGESDVLSSQVFRSPQRPRPEDPCIPSKARTTAAQRSLSWLTQTRDASVPPPDRVQACIRPMTPDGVPIVGQLLPFRNVFVATGGGAWGITFGPLMGQCLTALLTEETPPVRLAPLTPGRFDTMLYRTLLKQRKSPSAAS